MRTMSQASDERDHQNGLLTPFIVLCQVVRLLAKRGARKLRGR